LILQLVNLNFYTNFAFKWIKWFPAKTVCLKWAKICKVHLKIQKNQSFDTYSQFREKPFIRKTERVVGSRIGVLWFWQFLYGTTYNKADHKIGRQAVQNRCGEVINELGFDWTDGFSDDGWRMRLKQHFGFPTWGGGFSTGLGHKCKD